ncbi:hypothetical protein [Mycolicibacterium sp. CR10]|uniref:hypothetical protein n=1 Tax=Mycolicibacterium sp. CR10 TaxID=2562314 RepID=UPI0010C0DA56|nr:hypothetical protein [Mycolicibacterium sp. CR10]
MPTTTRSYVAAGVALVGAGVISATPITVPLPDSQRTGYDVDLVAAVQSCADAAASPLCDGAPSLQSAVPFTPSADMTNMFNIPANLFIALANTPYNFFNALGEGNVQLGSDPNGDFSFQPTYEGVTLTQPEGNVVGLGRQLRYTGNWWVYSQTNILGIDPADPSRVQAITNVLIPFPALSVPLGNIFAAIGASQLPMNIGCTGTGPGACDDPVAILSKMFDVRHIAALFSPEGYTYPKTIAPITCSADGECYVKDPEGPEVPWSGQTVKLDPATPFTSFYNSLTKTPDYSTITPATPELVTGSLVSLGTGLNTDFNPFVLGTQCGICAPFVPNPDNKPIPGPVFEDPDTAAPVTAAPSTPVTTTAPEATAETLSTPALITGDGVTPEAGTAKSGPKHRKPDALSGTVKKVQDSINSSISKLTDSFTKPKAGDKAGEKAGESADAPSATSDATSAKSSDSDSSSDD